jgi:hypothetical protein
MSDARQKARSRLLHDFMLKNEMPLTEIIHHLAIGDGAIEPLTSQRLAKIASDMAINTGSAYIVGGKVLSAAEISNSGAENK